MSVLHRLKIGGQGEPILFDGKPLKGVTGFRIECRDGFAEATIEIDCTPEINGILIPSNAKAMYCKRCGRIICFTTGASVGTAKCNFCGAVNRKKRRPTEKLTRILKHPKYNG